MKWSALSSWPHCYKYRWQLPNKSFGKDAIELEIEQIKKDTVLAERYLRSRLRGHEKQGGEI